MPAWVEQWPSVARRTGQRATPYVGWPTLYRHIGFLESWASLSTGVAFALPTALTNQSYTLSSPSVTMQAQNGSQLGYVTNTTFGPQGWDLMTSGDLCFIASPGFIFSLCPQCSIQCASSTVAYALLNSQTTILPSVNASFWVVRVAWSSTWQFTTYQVGIAPYPQLPVLQGIGTTAPLAGVSPQWTLPSGIFLGGAPLMPGNQQKYSIWCTTPGTQYAVPYALSSPSIRWYDFGASWGRTLPAAPSGQSYTGTPTLHAATSTTASSAVGVVSVSGLGNALSGDFVYVGAAGTSFPQFQLAPGITLQGTSTTVTLTANSSTQTVSTPGAGASWIARLVWSTSGGTTTLQAGASATLSTPPALTLSTSVTALSSISPQFLSGTWGGATPLAFSGTSTPHVGALAQLNVTQVTISTSESGSGTEGEREQQTLRETGVDIEQERITAMELVPETALGAELLTLLGKLIVSGSGHGNESISIGVPVKVTESATGTENLSTLVAFLLSEIISATQGLDALFVAVNQSTQYGSNGYITPGPIENLVTGTQHISLKPTAKGAEKLVTKHPKSESGTGTEALTLRYTATLRESGKALETVGPIPGVRATLVLAQESATGTASLIIHATLQATENGTGSDIVRLVLPLRDQGLGHEQLLWTQYQFQLPQQQSGFPQHQGLEQPIIYTGVANQLLFGSLAPGQPISASGPVTLGQTIPVGSIYSFAFPHNASLAALNGQTVAMTFQIPDGRWYTGTAQLQIVDQVGNNLTLVWATLTQALALAQPRASAMMY